MGLLSESSNYRPGEQLREWSASDRQAAIDAELIIQYAKAESAITKMVKKEELTVEDQLALGRLISWCVQMWYEPMVMLIDRPRLHPALPELLRNHTKVLKADGAAGEESA